MGKYSVTLHLRGDDIWFAIFHHPDGDIVGDGKTYEEADGEMTRAVHAKYPDLHPPFLTDQEVEVGEGRVLLNELLARRAT